MSHHARGNCAAIGHEMGGLAFLLGHVHELVDVLVDVGERSSHTTGAVFKPRALRQNLDVGRSKPAVDQLRATTWR